MTPVISHADLLRAFECVSDNGCNRAASVCGFEMLEPEEPCLPIAIPGQSSSDLGAPERDVSLPETREEEDQHGEFWLLRPATMIYRDAAEKAAKHWLLKTPPIAPEKWRMPQHPPPPPRKSELMPWPRLWPFLHRCQSRRRSGPKLAVGRLVATLAKLAPLTTIPYEPIWQWTRDSWIVLDLRDTLFPFHDDMLDLVRRWRMTFGPDACHIVVSPKGQPPNDMPPPETPALYIGDFGMLNNSGNSPHGGHRRMLRAWSEYGHRLQRRKSRTYALLPCPRHRWDPAISSVWTCACWSEMAQPPSVDRGWSPQEGKPGDDRAAFECLSDLAAPALRIEMPLLRALRRLLPPDLDHPGIEYDFFHACTRDLDAVVMSGEAAMRARPGFRSLPFETRQRIVELLRRHHTDHAEIVRARETLVLEACGAPMSDKECKDARDLVQQACAALLRHLQAEDREAILRAGFANWQQCELESFTESTAEETAVIWRFLQELLEHPETARPAVIADQDLLWLEGILRKAISQEINWQLRHVGDNVRFESPSTDDDSVHGIHYGGPPVRFPARNQRLEIIRRSPEGYAKRDEDFNCGYRIRHERCVQEIEMRTDLSILRYDAIRPPDWVSRFGWDRFGLFADFEVGGVTFALRWIPPGEFQMGSSEDEPGRGNAEGPPHRVTIGQGFWMASTPVTQAQYAAITGQRPSRFKNAGDRAPVENVSWDDCRKFCDKLQVEMIQLDKRAEQELTAGLPSEAQWEYACRAGTDSALYTGPLAILGENNGPELDAIAWYGGNSGVDYEGAHDSSAWPNKQYEHRRAGTHPVATKQANPWGLYDMLGNVWEWCEDPWHDNYEGAPDDGTVWADNAAEGYRVFRGGSWAFAARYCRCACRDWWHPGLRGGGSGFRFVFAARFNEDIRRFP